MKKTIIRSIRTLVLLLAISMAPLFKCMAQTETVFLDFTTNDSVGEDIIGQVPDVGLGALDGDSGGTLEITTNYSIDTVGAGRLVFGAFTTNLGAGQVITLSFNLLDFGPAWPDSGGYAGVSLYTNYESYTDNETGNEEQFVGEPYFANQWGVDGVTTGNVNSGNTVTPAFAVYTYVYDTGAWTFTTTGGVNESGTGVSNQLFNAVRVANGAGADIELNYLRAQITPLGAPVITQEPTPESQIAYAGQSAAISAQVAGTAPLTNQWLVESNGVYVPLQNGVDVNGSTVSGANTTKLTISGLTLADGTNYEFITQNALGGNTNLITAALFVSNGPAYFPARAALTPTNSQAYSGAPVTYSLAALGSQPISYQWTVNGIAVSGATNSTFTFSAPCGTSLIQLSVSNSYNTSASLSDVAVLEAENSLSPVTFETNGTGWSINGNAIFVEDNMVQLSDCGGNEASSLFDTNAQYVASGFTASYVYQVTSCPGVPEADGTTFVVQNSPAGPNALGAGGGGLGYGGINNSIAVEFNLYYESTNFPGWDTPENLGMTILTNGLTGANGNNGNYFATGSVFLNSGDPISVLVNYANGVIAVQLEDQVTLGTFSTNLAIGPIEQLLGSQLGFVGFTGGDGGAASSQTVSNFVFSPLIPPLSLAIAVGGGGVVVSWPAANPNYTLETTTSLTGVWSAGPAATIVGGTASVTVTPTGGSQFYRLVLGCQ